MAASLVRDAGKIAGTAQDTGVIFAPDRGKALFLIGLQGAGVVQGAGVHGQPFGARQVPGHLDRGAQQEGAQTQADSLWHQTEIGEVDGPGLARVENEEPVAASPAPSMCEA